MEHAQDRSSFILKFLDKNVYLNVYTPAVNILTYRIHDWVFSKYFWNNFIIQWSDNEECTMQGNRPTRITVVMATQDKMCK